MLCVDNLTVGGLYFISGGLWSFNGSDSYGVSDVLFYRFRLIQLCVSDHKDIENWYTIGHLREFGIEECPEIIRRFLGA